MRTIKLLMELQVEGDLNSDNPEVDYMEPIGRALLYHGNTDSLGFNFEEDDIYVSKVILSTEDGAIVHEFTSD